MVGQTKIELLEPTSEDSTVAKFIEKKVREFITLHMQPKILMMHLKRWNQKV